MSREARVLALTDVVARGVLRAYPTAFRRRMGHELRLCLRDAARAAWRAGGWPRVLLFAGRAAVDLVAAAVAERWSQAVHHLRGRPEPAPVCALLGGVSWLVMVGNTVLRSLPAGANAVLAAVAAACFGLALFHASRAGWNRAGDAGRAGAWLAVAGAVLPVAIGLVRLIGHPLRSADFMDGFFVMLLGWIVLGAVSLGRQGGLPRPAGGALLAGGLAGVWVGVGDRHGFGALAMLPPLSLIGVLWILMAAWLAPPRPAPDGRGMIQA